MEKATAREIPGNEASSDRRALQNQHHELERQLAALDRHLSLTPDEQVELRRLKKQKLLVKDQLLRLGASGPRDA
jgi:hypothetical protein